MSFIDRIWLKLLRIWEYLMPYIRITRMLVTFIAPMILAIMYLMHQSFRTRKIQELIQSYRGHRSIVSMSGFRYGLTSVSTQPSAGVMDLSHLNDMFWVRLTQVISAMVGY